MKILMATGIFPPDIGGPATYVTRLCDELKTRGHEVGVITFSNDTDMTFDYPITRINRKASFIVKYARYFMAVARESRKYDLVFAQGPFSSGFACALNRLFFRKKFILKIVGDTSWEFAQGNRLTDETIEEFQTSRGKFLKIKLVRFVQSFSCRMASGIITPSEFLKGIVQQWGAPASKINVIYNAADLEPLDVDREHAKKALDLSGKQVLVSAGRFVPWKGFEALFEVIARLVTRFPQLTLVLIGGGPDRPRLEAKIKSLNLNKHIHLTGKIPHKNVTDYLCAADAFVLNTDYEGFSHVLLEAMACGAPIITTNRGGNPELIDDNKTGRLLPFSDLEAFDSAITDLLSHPEKGEGWFHAAKPNLSYYRWDRLMDDFLAFTKQFL